MRKKISIVENNIIASNTIRKKLIERLLAEGYCVTILTTGSKEEIATVRNAGVGVVDIGSSTQNPLKILKFLFMLGKGLVRTETDICLTFTIRPAIWGNLIAGLLRIPVITNITGIGPLFTRNNIAYRSARLLYRIALRKTVKVFFQNYDDLNIFIEKKIVSHSKVYRIPGSGIDYNYFYPRDKTENLNKFVFVFISRLVKDKGVLEFVDAARILKAKLTDAVFFIVGPIWMQNLKENSVTKEDVSEWEQKGYIQYLGQTGDVRKYIGESDCVVLPSYREGLSNVLLEASSMKRPTITTNVTGCRDVVDDRVTGLLCNVRDSNDLAAKMEIMYRLPVEIRKKMGEAARLKVIQEFDKEIVVQMYLDTIGEIAGAV